VACFPFLTPLSLTFAPFLAPTINNFTMAASLSGLAAHMLNPEIWSSWDVASPVVFASQTSFCLAMGVLGNAVLNNMPLLVYRVTNFYKPAAWGQSQLREELEATFEGIQAIGLFTLGCLPWILRSDPGVQARNDLPHPAELPLLQGEGDVPLPDRKPRNPFVPEADSPEAGSSALACSSTSMNMFGTAPSWVRWLRSNVDSLINDLGNGEWVGYVSTSQGRNGDVPPPARGIRFTTRLHPELNRCLLVNGDGVDGRGTFSLAGQVELLTGSITLTKRWTEANMPAHNLVGAITPLGIAGSWSYHSAPGAPMGLMWIYKKEWARERSSSSISNTGA
jgi:hypothetical protein